MSILNVELFKCHTTDSVVESMKKIDRNSYGLLYVVDDKETLVGCVTDGDIRRWLIKGGELKAPIEKAMNTKPVSVKEEQSEEGMRIMREKLISSVAVVDSKGHIVNVLLFSPKAGSIIQNTALINTPVIVMAGGKGTRLHPYTKILPKPLIPVGEIPILERILDRFVKYGVKEFYLTINYRKEMIKSYFSETNHSYRLKYIEEDKPLGTAGSIRLIKDEFSGPIIITNCDILIEADYADILKHHIESGNELTIVSSLKNTVIPYGVLRVEESGIVTAMEEKPELSHFINTGMYVLDPEYVKWIPEGKLFHMTELAELMINKGKRVGMYPITENSFLDMGEFAEMKRMEERINAGFVE